MKVDVHGTCVSYSLLKKNDNVGFQHEFEEVETNLYFSHVNIAGSVFSPIHTIPSKEDFHGWGTPHVIRNIITDLSKDVIARLLASEADWLLIDFYDFARIQWAYENGSYTHVGDLRVAAPMYYRKIEGQIKGCFRWLDIPEFLWYPCVDEYFEKILSRFKDHVILNRVYLNQYYLTEQGTWQKFQKIGRILEVMWIMRKYIIWKTM